MRLSFLSTLKKSDIYAANADDLQKIVYMYILLYFTRGPFLFSSVITYICHLQLLLDVLTYFIWINC